MFRNLCILLAVLFITLAAFGVDGPTVGDGRLSWFYLGLAFWALSFFDHTVVTARRSTRP